MAFLINIITKFQLSHKLLGGLNHICTFTRPPSLSHSNGIKYFIEWKRYRFSTRITLCWWSNFDLHMELFKFSHPSVTRKSSRWASDAFPASLAFSTMMPARLASERGEDPKSRDNYNITSLHCNVCKIMPPIFDHITHNETLCEIFW